MPGLLGLGAILGGGAAVAGVGLQVWDYISNSDQRRIQNEVMTEGAAFNKDLLRRARGKFTDAELSQIQQANAPALQAVSGNVSARLGAGSPLAASITNQAQQQTVFNAQQHATAGALGLRGGGGGTMPQPNTLFKSLGEIAAAIDMLKKTTTTDTTVDTQYDGTILNAVDIINKNMSGQGYIPTM